MEKVGFSIVGKMAEWMFEPIQRELGYLLCFNSNIQELQTRLGELKATRNDGLRMEDAEKKMGKTLGDRVQLWIEKSDEKIVEAENVLNDKAEFQKGCFSIKWCPNLILRFSLGRKGKKSSLVLIELLQSGGQLPHTGHVLPMPSINMRDYNGDACDFESRSKIMEDIIEMLQDKKTMLIGICGMGGIGKTTFAKQVLQEVKDSHKHLFGIQVFTTVSSSPDFNNIQQEVVEMLGSFSLKGIDGKIARANYLRNAFRNKKVVVVLDDVWEKFDLNAFGFPLTKSDVGCCCKIIYTSRIQGLWPGERTITKKEISIQLLSSQEALNLFKRKVNIPNNDVDFHWKNRIAMQIVEECGGLLLALEVVGGALTEKHKHEWNNMFSQLRNHGQDPRMEEINKALKTSYNFLEDPNAKLLFLLCCLFREDQRIPIETLYRYVVGLQLFKNINVDNLKCTRDCVYTLVDNLIRRNLLIKVEARYGEPAVKMHDLLREVGISIAKQENNGIKFLDCDGVDKLENFMSPDIKMISILFQKDLEVPEKLALRDLKLELLRLHSSGNTISGSLFQGQDNLKVLDINFGGMIIEFPYLAKLNMLSLVGLSFDMTLSFLDLKCLEILSLQWLTVQILPKEISELTNLRLLDLTGCECLIRNGVLSRLTNLQELYMWDSFQDWRLHKEDVNSGDNIAAGLDELNFLPKMWRLELEIPNIEQVPRDVTLFSSSVLLEQFKIRIGGGEREGYIKFESGERQLWLENVKGNTSFFHELKVLTEKDITNLYLCTDSGVWKNIHLNNFPSLKDIVLKHCGYLFLPQSKSSLQTSELGRCLRRIELYECNEMTHLCSTSISRNLTNLQVLILEDCKMTKEVVSSCDETEQLNKIEFNALETLKLCDLSSLECFCKRVDEIHFHKLKILELEGLKQFIFPTKLEIPCLEELRIVSMPNIITLLNIMPPSLQKLNIDNCDDFQYFDFSNSLVMNVIFHLQNLTITNCEMLEGVVGVTSGVGELQRKSIKFPNLSTLELESLDKLASFVIDVNNMGDKKKKMQRALFYHDDYQVWFPRLRELTIYELPKINYILGQRDGGRKGQGHHHHPDYNKIFPVLRRMELIRLRKLKHVYEINQQGGLRVLLFQNLTELVIRECGELRYLFSENIAKISAKHLQSIKIYNCGMMEVLMKKEDDEDKARGGSNFFPVLEEMRLRDLSTLRSFCDVSYTWELPLLKKLVVNECPKLEALSPGYLDSPRLEELWYHHDRYKENVKNTWKGDVNGALRHIFIMRKAGRLEKMYEEWGNSVKERSNI